jgi:hypothetical protein
MRIQKVENVNKALEFMRLRNLQLTNIGAEGVCIRDLGLNERQGRNGKLTNPNFELLQTLSTPTRSSFWV